LDIIGVVYYKLDIKINSPGDFFEFNIKAIGGFLGENENYPLPVLLWITNAHSFHKGVWVPPPFSDNLEEGR